MTLNQMFFKVLGVIPMMATLMLLTLTGCGTTKPDTELKIESVRVEKVTVPQELTEPCLPEKPITKEDYLKLKPHEREEELTRYTVSLLGTVKVCNVKLSKIRKLNEPEKK